VHEQDSAVAVVDKAITKHLKFHPDSSINFYRIKYDLALRVYKAIKNWNDCNSETDPEETLRKPIFNDLELSKFKESSGNKDKQGEKD